MAASQTGIARISLASGSVPSSRTNHWLVVRCRTTTTPGALARIRASLYEGSTDRSGVLEAAITSSTLTAYSIAIPDVVAAAITSYSDLEVRLWGYQSDGTPLTYQVAEVRLEIPGASPATTVNGASASALNFNATTSGSVPGGIKLTAVARISLEGGTDPGVDTGHVIQVRARSYSGNGVIRVALYEGASNRSGDLETSVLGTSFSDNTLNISSAAAAAITSYANLEIRLWGASTLGASFDVARVGLALPAPVGGGGGMRVGIADETSSVDAVSSPGGIVVIYPGTAVYPSEMLVSGIVLVGIATETSSADPVGTTGAAAVVVVGIPQEISVAPSAQPPIFIVVTIPEETSSASRLTFLGGSQKITVGIAEETNETGATSGSGAFITRSVIRDGDENLVIGARVADIPLGTYDSYLYAVVDEIAILGSPVSDREVADLYARVTHNGVDGPQYNSSTGIWRGTKNYVPNGGFEGGIALWETYLGTLSHETGQALFGHGALKFIGPSTANARILMHVVPSTGYVASVWLKGSGVVKLGVQEYNDSFALLGQSQSSSIALDGSWKRYSVTRSFGSTGTYGLVYVEVQSATSTVYIDGVQMEAGSSPTPYVETNGTTGDPVYAGAVRGAARVQVPAGYLDGGQGWVAARVRVGWSGATAYTQNPRILTWLDDVNNWLSLYYHAPTQRFSLWRQAPGSGAGAVVNRVVAPGDRVTVVAAWTASNVKLSVDGAPFAVTVAPNPVALTAPTFDVGSSFGDDHLNGDILWLATGVGTLTDTDARVLHDWNDEPPRLHTYPAASLVRFAWDGVDDHGLEAGFTHTLSTGKLRRIFHKPGSKRGSTELEVIDNMERLSTELGLLAPVANGEYMGEAVSRILKKIGMEDPSLWDLDDGEPGLTRVENNGDLTWLALLVEIISSDYGIFLINSEGHAVYRERRSRPLAPYRGRLSRELHALEPGVDLDRIVNTWAVTAADQPEEVEADNYPVAVSTFQKSYRKYGIRASERTANHLSTRDQAYSLAEHLVRRTAEPDAPVYAVSLTNRSDRQLALALSLEIGDMIEVFGKQTIGHYIVEQVSAEVNVTEGTHEVALIVSAP